MNDFSDQKRTLQQFMNQRGAALMGVLVVVVILGLLSGIAGSTWQTIVQRAKEEELLWRGNQYRQAIESYFKVTHGGTQGQLPSDLESLVKDPRSVTPLRHLRKLFPDPMTGEDWVFVKDPSGRISGVRSSSTLEPFKKAGFSEVNKDFEGKESYNDWQFVFDVTKAIKNKNPVKQQPTLPGATQPPTPGALQPSTPGS